MLPDRQPQPCTETQFRHYLNINHLSSWYDRKSWKLLMTHSSVCDVHPCHNVASGNGVQLSRLSQINLISVNSFRWNSGYGGAGIHSSLTELKTRKTSENYRVNNFVRGEEKQWGKTCSLVIFISGASLLLSGAAFSAIHHSSLCHVFIGLCFPLLLIWVLMMKTQLSPLCFFQCHFCIYFSVTDSSSNHHEIYLHISNIYHFLPCKCRWDCSPVSRIKCYPLLFLQTTDMFTYVSVIS